MRRVGLRREDKNEWERRVALTPDHVAELAERDDLAVTIQPSERRAFPDRDYRAAGAVIDEDLSACDVIFGIKEVPPDKLVPGRPHAFFSHVIKGQPANMPMLSRLLELGSSLVDYERIVDRRGRRLVFFGRYAGYAGMIDALWALGRRLAAEGFATPFERVRLAHDYSSLDEATHHLSRIGEELRHRGLPEELRPMVFGFTGSGNVSLGAQEIAERLPIVEVLPEELAAIPSGADYPRNVLYKVAFERQHRFRRADGGPFDAAELDAAPERYTGGLERWLGELTLLVHGSFWSPPQPRLVTIEGLGRLWSGPAPPRLRVLADISCDVGGGIECTVRATSPGDPVYVYDLRSGRDLPGVAGCGPVVLAVDNLPCQLPAEASEHFGDTLLRFVPQLAACPWHEPLDALGLPEELARAVIVHRGELTPRYAYLAEHLGRVHR